MNKQDSEKFKSLINDLEFFDLVKEYAEYRIKALHRSIENISDPTEVFRVQGQIKELRRFDTLRDEVLNPDQPVKTKV